MFFKKKDPFFYGKSDLKDPFFSKLFYCPHPFTNWSLNPLSKNNKNELMHTIEGFRKTSKVNSIKEELSDHEGVCQIYCLGGSTTYCDGLYDYRDSWPFKLRELINKNSKNLLINAGVGGWSTIQSLIRYSTWGALIKPKITIFYQAKNDLTPLFNGRSCEKKLFPLLENVMLQLDTSFNSNPRLYKKNNDGLASVYTKQILADPDGLNRFDDEWKYLYEVRCNTIAQIASQWGGKIYFIPELYSSDTSYFKALTEMHLIMEKVAKKNANSEFFDLRKTFEFNKKDFLDKCHFSKSGTTRFSNFLFEKLVNEVISN
tara:strand:+ start:1413 stop:2360 length:948 start_codon:yes stop_codon:yes gene_type:complete